MSEPKHLDTGKRARIRVRPGQAGAHRAPGAVPSSDERLEVCVPELADRYDTEVGDEIEAALPDKPRRRPLPYPRGH